MLAFLKLESDRAAVIATLEQSRELKFENPFHHRRAFGVHINGPGRGIISISEWGTSRINALLSLFAFAPFITIGTTACTFHRHTRLIVNQL